MNDAISTRDLVKKFRRVEALRGVNLSVPEGAIFAMVGPNGAGKTTAIKILMNIFGATSGQAQVLGVSAHNIRGKAFAQIGYVSENQDMPAWMTVGAFLSYLEPFYPSWDKALERQLISQFDLPLERKLRHLSRGVRMKAALASSLAFHPKLIVLDEPFTGLDPLVRDELIQGLLERAEESTIFISSHDLAEIESFASHVAYLEQGKLRFAEELTTLANRFREVEVTFNETRPIAEDVPSNWMSLSSTAAVVHFVESAFDENRTTSAIHTVLGNPRNIAFTPMSLRSIFLAMARAGRNREPEL
jgi:ABC-2 type transport system ATP-binding protein